MSRSAAGLLLLIAAFTALFGFFCMRRFESGVMGDADVGLSLQMFHSALLGLPFFNTYENQSHFAVHASYVYGLLLPFYALAPGPLALFGLQAGAVALSAWPAWLLARQRLGTDCALPAAALLLMYHPLHGVAYDQFNELAFAVAPLLFALYFFLQRRWAWFWPCLLLTLTVKEDTSFVAMFWGLFCLGVTTQQRWRGRSVEKPLLLHGAGMLAAGMGVLYLDLYIVIPYFQHGFYRFFIQRYGELGNSLPEVLETLVLHPLRVLGFLVRPKALAYVAEMLLPFAFLPLASPGLLCMAAPSFAINMLSTNTSMQHTGGRYVALMVPFIFGAAVLALERFSNSERRRWLLRLLLLAAICTLAFDTSPLKLGRHLPPLGPRQQQIMALARSIPADASVATQVGIYQYVAQRLPAWARWEPGCEYVLVDDTTEFYAGTHWDRDFPQVLASGRYDRLYERDGVHLLCLRARGGGSSSR
jgi:uncharacterized membrane protein